MIIAEKDLPENLNIEDVLNKIIHGDAIRVLRKLPSNSVDLVILDPPYTELRDSRAYEWNLNLNWGALFKQIRRIVKPNGYVFLFGFPSYFLKIANHIISNFEVHFDLIWIKPIPLNFLKAKMKPMNQHEQILCLVRPDGKDTERTYNYREIGYYAKPYIMKRHGAYTKYGDVIHSDTYCEDGFRYPTTLVFAPSKEHMPKDERTEHPTQKPLKLIEFLVKGFSNKHDIVLDPFLGSGTTAVACVRNMRYFIGIEIERKWCEVAAQRVSNDLHNLKLTLFVEKPQKGPQKTLTKFVK
ncbi:MAG: DNA-methyltransferase [Candidatus Baldrarchaeia archaeon]